MHRFFTPDQYSYETVIYRVFHTNGITFKVKACNDAHIALFDHYHTARAYEIVIGSNGNSVTRIKKKLIGSSEVQVETPDILSCTDFGQFWVTWANGRIALGYGDIEGILEIAAFEDDDPHSVSYLAISTGWGSEGEWEFFTLPGISLLPF